MREDLTRVRVENDRRRQENERLREIVDELEEQLRRETRSASPFSKQKPKANPKRPGRKRGEGPHRVGPRLKAMAHALHYGHGVPVSKLPPILLETSGVTLTPGAITQDALRKAAGVVGNAYQDARA